MDTLLEISKKFKKKSQSLQLALGDDYIIYNPLVYAWDVYQLYLERYGIGKKKVLFVGINPGPFGMAQTGIPFGEVHAVLHFLKLFGHIEIPSYVHPKRPVLGFECKRSEVSGRRLWALFQERFGSADLFFKGHYVVNYCPLLFLNQNACNVTPDKLPADKVRDLWTMCDEHLKTMVQLMDCEWVIGVGGLMYKQCQKLFDGCSVKIGSILHPSPANPQANRMPWAIQATQQLIELGVWV